MLSLLLSERVNQPGETLGVCGEKGSEKGQSVVNRGERYSGANFTTTFGTSPISMDKPRGLNPFMVILACSFVA
jgi:hypothetical protein